VLPAFGNLEVLEGFDGDEPRLRPPASPVLIRHLMTHTSGLSYWFSSADILRWHELTGTPPVLSGKLGSIRTPLLHDPGERWTYGVSTDWLGQVIEAVSGKSLEDYLREHVWGPLDMPDATFYPSDEQRARMPALKFRAPDGQLVDAPLEDVEWEFASGGGGGHATARDYARFQRMLLRGGELDGERVLKPETVELMFTDHLQGAPLPEIMESAVPELSKDVPAMPFKQGWGLGLHLLLEDIPNMRRAGSGDWAGLFNCYFWIDRSSGLTAALMTQLLPFFDDRMVETLLGFEAAVYAQVGAPTT
jgi:methyl acetate hydrolase